MQLSAALLTDTITLRVRFGESDAIGVAWHGSYVPYLEDGREHFGKAYPGLGYRDYFDNRTMAPVVNLQIDYIQPLRPGDVFTVETRYVASPGASVTFQYVLRRQSDGATVAQGQTTQLFTTPEGEMLLTEPPFYTAWKRRHLK